jgi:hypothetical protein
LSPTLISIPGTFPGPEFDIGHKTYAANLAKGSVLLTGAMPPQAARWRRAAWARRPLKPRRTRPGPVPSCASSFRWRLARQSRTKDRGRARDARKVNRHRPDRYRRGGITGP